jgi:hypothetical protein
VQEQQIDWRTNSPTTLMKKLFSLVLIAIVAIVAGCNKPDDGSKAAGTNAPAKP